MAGGAEDVEAASNYCHPFRQYRHIRSTFIGRNAAYWNRCSYCGSFTSFGARSGHKPAMYATRTASFRSVKYRLNARTSSLVPQPFGLWARAWPTINRSQSSASTLSIPSNHSSIYESKMLRQMSSPSGSQSAA